MIEKNYTQTLKGCLLPGHTSPQPQVRATPMQASVRSITNLRLPQHLLPACSNDSRHKVWRWFFSPPPQPATVWRGESWLATKQPIIVLINQSIW
jgi:hypothetical protein